MDFDRAYAVLDIFAIRINRKVFRSRVDFSAGCKSICR